MVKLVGISAAIGVVVALTVIVGSGLFGIAQHAAVAVAIGAVAGACYAAVAKRQLSSGG